MIPLRTNSKETMELLEVTDLHNEIIPWRKHLKDCRQEEGE